MVTRSLVTKLYLYLLVAALVLVPLTQLGAEMLFHRGQLDGFHQTLLRQESFVQHEVVASLHDGRPDPRRLAALEAAFGFRLAFVPWANAADYPAELRAHAAIGDFGPQGPARWVRLEASGHPVGALSVRFLPPPPPSVPHLWILGWLAIVTGVIIPPIVWWVLRPLKAMVAVANRLGLGHLDVPVPIDRADEFGDLERAFETLRNRVQAMIAQRERLLTDISHEIRAPLQRMSLVVPLLRQGRADATLVDILDGEIQGVDGMLGELLAYLRAGHQAPLRCEPIDLAVLTHELIAARRLVAESHGLDVAPRLETASVMVEPRLLARALGNVIDNALKYTPPGGHVRVACGPGALGAWFEVEDDGPGIPADDLPHVLEPFYRPDSSRSRETGGTGLGLAIVGSVVEAHGGSVSIQSEEGRGTCVRIQLVRA